MIALSTPLAPLSRLLNPFAPAWVEDAWPRAVQSRLTHCLLLALLLHLWLVLMLGNAPPGTAPPGQGVGGALNVTLRGPAQDGPVAIATLPAPPAGLPGTAPSPRSGGTVRPPSPQPPPGPGAARQGDWARTPAPVAQAPAAAEPPAEPAAVSPSVPPSEPVRLAPPAPAALARLPSLPERLAAPAPPSAAPVAAPALPSLPAAVVPAAAVPANPLPAAPVLRQVAPMVAPSAPALSPVQALPAQAPVGLPALPAAPAGQPTTAAGRPDAGPQLGHDVATAPSAPASAPRLNLELARPRGGELSRQGGSGVLPLLPRPPELPDKLARDIEKSGRADCRKAYQGLGLMAVVPLAVDAVRGASDRGCKW